MLLFLLFLGCFFLGCHELNASLRRFSCFGARSHFFEAQRIVPLNAYTQDIEVLMLHCQQKNAYGDDGGVFFISERVEEKRTLWKSPSSSFQTDVHSSQTEQNSFVQWLRELIESRVPVKAEIHELRQIAPADGNRSV